MLDRVGIGHRHQLSVRDRCECLTTGSRGADAIGLALMVHLHDLTRPQSIRGQVTSRRSVERVAMKANATTYPANMAAATGAHSPSEEPVCTNVRAAATGSQRTNADPWKTSPMIPSTASSHTSTAAQAAVWLRINAPIETPRAPNNAHDATTPAATPITPMSMFTAMC